MYVTNIYTGMTPGTRKPHIRKLVVLIALFESVKLL